MTCCNDIMKKSIVTLRTDDSAQVAARLMSDANVGFLPVCEGGRAIGTLTDRDLALRVIRHAKPASTLVNDIMTHEVIACGPFDSIETAADIMAENQVSRLLINDENGKLIGVLSLSDLPRASAETAFETLKEVSQREAPPAY